MAQYVNNKEFLAAMVERREQVKKAEKEGKPKPQVSNYIGECILKIANHLSYKPNFINYSYREEMISDGIENCLQYIDNFNPEKSSNPFAYFTQIIYYAFLRRITKEKKQTYIRGKMIQDLPMELFDTHDSDGAADSDYTNTYMEFLQANHQVDDFFERKAAERKAKKLEKKKDEPSLDDFMGGDDSFDDSEE